MAAGENKFLKAPRGGLSKATLAAWIVAMAFPYFHPLDFVRREDTKVHRARTRGSIPMDFGINALHGFSQIK